MENSAIQGVLVVNKPVGITSFDCIRHIKRLAKYANVKGLKIGHAGTLDDFAQGLLLICIGRQATKLVPLLMDLAKEYVVKVKLGELTDSLDLTGKVLAVQDIPPLSVEVIQQAFIKLGSSYEQVPPIFSALKFQGKPLYELARKKKADVAALQDIALQKKRLIYIYDYEIINLENGYLTFRALVSKGTYVRSLASDLTQVMGVFSTVYELNRTKIGSISMCNSILLSDLKSFHDVENNLISADRFVQLIK